MPNHARLFALAIALGCPAALAADPSHPIPQATELQVLIARRCANLDVALSRPGASRQCEAQALQALSEIQRLADDESIPDLVWLSCRQESGATYSAQFELWARCLKVAQAGCNLTTTYVGLGIGTQRKDGDYVVSSVRSGGPAAKAGVAGGEVVVEIGGQSVAGLTEDTISALLRGSIGTAVSLTLRRRDGERRVVTIRRAEIRVPNDDSYAHVSCAQMIQSGNWVYNRSVK